MTETFQSPYQHRSGPTAEQNKQNTSKRIDARTSHIRNTNRPQQRQPEVYQSPSQNPQQD
eukprot:2808069-Lingulodinium_polyedra.AAC.1